MALELHGTTGVSLVQDGAGMPSGTPLQIIHATTTTEVTLNNNTETDTTLTATITPSSTSSKILITFSYHVYIDSTTAGTWRGLLVRLMRVTGDTVLLADPNSGYGVGANWNDGSDRNMVYATSSHLDSPNSTSAITYGLECRSKSGSSVDINASGYGRGGFIQLQEIAQ